MLRIVKDACLICGTLLFFYGVLYLTCIPTYLFFTKILGYVIIELCQAYENYLFRITAPATIYQGCINRVSSDQAALFDPGNLQSNLSILDWGEYAPTFNDTLCHSGFVGNSDIYGLGVRSGLYLQWVSSLLAKHLLPEESTALMRSYLIFHIALCIAVTVLTVQKTCTFAVKIVLLYYLVFGGFICVFSKPNLGDSEPAMMDLHWSQVFKFLSFLTMVIHVVWFILFGHFSLPNMPCESTIFFFGPVNSQWMDICLILLVFFLIINVLCLGLLMIVPICGPCFVSVVKSLLSKGLLPRVRDRSVVLLQSASPRYLRFSRILEWLAAQPGNIYNKYGSALRRCFRTYTMSRPFYGQLRRCIPVSFEL